MLTAWDLVGFLVFVSIAFGSLLVLVRLAVIAWRERARARRYRSHRRALRRSIGPR